MITVLDYFERVQALVSGLSGVEIERYEERVLSPARGNMRIRLRWLDSLNFDVVEAHSYNMNSSNKREVKKIIFEFFDFIETEWNKLQKERRK